MPANAIALSVLSLKGPSDPAGPAAATSLVDLINTLRGEQRGKALACPGSCWGDARINGPTLLLAVRLGTEACYKVARAYAVPQGDVSKLVVDIDADYLCNGDGGGGTRARASLVLLGVPVSRIPVHGATSIDGELATGPDSGFTSLGTAGVLLP